MEVQSKSELKRVAAMNRKDPADPAMVLTFEDLDKIGRVLKKNLTSDKDAFVETLSSLVSIDVDGVKVPLDPRLLMRLKSRCLDKPNWPKWLAEVTVKQLHDYAGY